MNRANVIGPSRAISSWIRATSSSSCPTASRSGHGIAAEARRHVHDGPRAPTPPDDQSHPRTDERVPAQQDRDRRRRRGRGQLPEPRIDDPLGEQQVRGEAILGGAARPPRRPRAGGPAGPGCRRSRRRTSGRAGRPAPRARPRRGRSRGRSIGAPAGRGACRRRADRQPRRGAQPALLDPGPDAASGVPFEPRQRRRRRPTGDEQLRRADPRRRPGSPPVGPSRARHRRAPRPAGRRSTTSSGPSMSNPSRQRRRRSSTR